MRAQPWWAGVVLMGLCLCLAARELDDLIADPRLFEQDRESFTRGHGRQGNWRWVSEARDQCRRADKDMRVLGFPCYEVLVRFKDEKVAEVNLSIYNRGDAGEISEDAFEDQVKAVGAKLAEFTGSKADKLDSYRQKDVRTRSYGWVKAPIGYILEWSQSDLRSSREDRPEYLRLRLEPLVDGRIDKHKQGPTRISTTTLVENLEKSDDGDVWISNVPMVDQGQKGYCAVAVTERILRYYQRDVDQHELAQIAQTQTGGGTDPRALEKGLDRFAIPYGIRVKVIEDAPDIRDLKMLVKRYNSKAKRLDKPEIDFPEPRGNVLYIDDIYKDMDGEVFVATRNRRDYYAERFLRDIKKSIDGGVPLCWSVRLGLVPEPGIPQRGGGHMRLIIGYNEKKGEIIYSDSWGRGHEKKRMGVAEAYAITTGILEITTR